MFLEPPGPASSLELYLGREEAIRGGLQSCHPDGVADRDPLLRWRSTRVGFARRG